VASEVEHALSEMAYMTWAVMTCEVEMGGTKSPEEEKRFPALARRYLPLQQQQGTMSFRQLLTVIDGLNRERHMRDCEGIVYLLELQRGKYYVGFMHHVYDNAHQGIYPDHEALLAPMLAEYRHGMSCAWTNMYPLKSVVATFPGYIADVKPMAELLAYVQGWDCVRSRSHNSILSQTTSPA
jgi:hypothetical protein